MEVPDTGTLIAAELLVAIGGGIIAMIAIGREGMKRWIDFQIKRAEQQLSVDTERDKLMMTMIERSLDKKNDQVLEAIGANRGCLDRLTECLTSLERRLEKVEETNGR